MVKENCEGHILSWAGGGDKTPIRILKSKLVPLDMSESTAKNTSPPTKNGYTVVWVMSRDE